MLPTFTYLYSLIPRPKFISLWTVASVGRASLIVKSNMSIWAEVYKYFFANPGVSTNRIHFVPCLISSFIPFPKDETLVTILLTKIMQPWFRISINLFIFPNFPDHPSLHRQGPIALSLKYTIIFQWSFFNDHWKMMVYSCKKWRFFVIIFTDHWKMMHRSCSIFIIAQWWEFSLFIIDAIVHRGAIRD